MDKISIVGIGASILTAASLVPQLLKIIREKKAEDISMVMLSILLCGLGLWIYYGIMKNDLIIVISNAFALVINLSTVALTLLYKK